MRTSEDVSGKKLLPQAKTDVSKLPENKKRKLTTTPEDAAGNKRQRPGCTDEAADTKTTEPVCAGDVTPLSEFGRMMSTMESMPWKFTIEESDLNEFSVEEKIALVEAMSPALPQLLYSVALQSKFAWDLVQHYKQLAAEERSKREEFERLCSVAECKIEELEKRLVVTQHEVSAANNKFKQNEAESQDLLQRNHKLETAKSAAQTEALEERQQTIELGLKAAKLEADRSAAEADAVEAKQQATDSELKSAKLQAAKSAGEAKKSANGFSVTSMH